MPVNIIFGEPFSLLQHNGRGIGFFRRVWPIETLMEATAEPMQVRRLGLDLTEAQARGIYRQGEEAVVFALLHQSKLLADAQRQGSSAANAISPCTPSGMRPVPAETFDFLGHTFGHHWTFKSQRMLLCGAPSKKRILRVCQTLSGLTARSRTGLTAATACPPHPTGICFVHENISQHPRRVAYPVQTRCGKYVLAIARSANLADRMHKRGGLCGHSNQPRPLPAYHTRPRAFSRRVGAEIHVPLINVDSIVHVYAPGGEDLDEHAKRVDRFNTRADNPTRWRQVVYTGPDYLQKMLAEKAGNVVVIAGNNARKTDFILQSVQAGFNVLADKPMAITPDDLKKLEQAFKVAAANHVLLYDIMTERFEITTLLEYELAHQPALFGELLQGTPDDPAIIKESIHYFSKTVAGVPLKRPGWFFDVRQAGEGIVDITTHLVDMIQWHGFSQPAVSAPTDVKMLSARRWPSAITREQFQKVTGGDFPAFLQPVIKNGVLQDFCNGEMTLHPSRHPRQSRLHLGFRIRLRLRHPLSSVLRGKPSHPGRSNKRAPQKYKPVLYISKNPPLPEHP